MFGILINAIILIYKNNRLFIRRPSTMDRSIKPYPLLISLLTMTSLPVIACTPCVSISIGVLISVRLGDIFWLYQMDNVQFKLNFIFAVQISIVIYTSRLIIVYVTSRPFWLYTSLFSSVLEPTTFHTERTF